MKIKGTVIGCLLFFSTLNGCSNFDALNGGIQVEPWPDNLEIQLSQKGGRLCYEIENESGCFQKGQSSYLDAYHEANKYNTFAKFNCRRMENVRNVCHVYKQMGGPKGGNVLRDKNRE
ncbi:hypothetical protein [Microbulbifer sp. SSSA005]|uniref:hypothetical protein n=1 Tax=Microbulbifer sp. SSSA005 TaxID=3243378 RepID=UPI004039157C